MTRLRADQNCAVHHIYQLEGTGEEIVIGDLVYLALRSDSPHPIESIVQDFPELEWVKETGRTHVFRVTERTTRNPLKIANCLRKINGVEWCQPKIFPRGRHCDASPIGETNLGLPSSTLAETDVALLANTPVETKAAMLANTHKLFDRQWHLIDQSLAAGASINVNKAWEHGFGNPDIVVAVIDDGFDIKNGNDSGHPAFFEKKISDAATDLVGNTGVPNSRGSDVHGTPVASLATAGTANDGMVGVAPDCTFLPLRVAVKTDVIDLDMVLEALEIASKAADVVNCSFSLAPTTVPLSETNLSFVEKVQQIIDKGGRLGKGLIIVFAAGNDDAPTFRSDVDNDNGLTFPLETGGFATTKKIGANKEIHSGFQEIPGVVVVAAMSSERRKAGYSNWGPHLTVTAPSNNTHEMLRVTDPNEKARFEASYTGLGLVAAVNRPTFGNSSGFHFAPLAMKIPDFDSSFYTETFGGTSGAAAIVTGVVALMLSANPVLTPQQVIQILKDNANKNLDFKLDLTNDPNLIGVKGEFVDGHSEFFGGGLIDAGRAVKEALGLKTMA